MTLNLEKIKTSLKSNQNSILLFLAILGAFITVALVIDIIDIKNINIGGNASAKAVAEKSIDYLNDSVLQEGQTATLVSFSEESGLIKIKIKIGDKDYDSYVTKDSKLFFPEALHMDSKGDEIIAE